MVPASRLKAFQLSGIIRDDESYHFSDAGTGGRYTFTKMEYGPSVRANECWQITRLVSRSLVSVVQTSIEGDGHILTGS